MLSAVLVEHHKQTDKRVESHRLPPLIESAAKINRTTPHSKPVSSTLDRPSMFATARLSDCVCVCVCERSLAVGVVVADEAE